MPRKRVEPEGRSVDLLEKLLALQLHTLGAAQDKIAQVLGKSKGDVNKFLKGVPKPKKEG